jgi:hypothetical protein
MNVIRGSGGYKKNDEESGRVGPFQNIEKSTVLQEV